MAKTNRKTLNLFLATWLTVLLSLVSCSFAAGEQFSPPLQPQGLDDVGIFALKETEPNLTGLGVKFAVICRSITYTDGQPQNNYQPDIEHDCLLEKEFTFQNQPQPTVDISAHSTAICSLLFGRDPNSYDYDLGEFNYQGIIPQADVNVYEFWHFLADNLFTNSEPNVEIITASFGSPFEHWWTRAIESLAEKNGTIIVASIGNGTDVYDPPLYPAASTNVIGVGVVDSVDSKELAINLANFSLAHSKHSSFGPTEDNRCKPDIVAPGNFLAANINEPNKYEPTGSWSSFSAPTVAGAIGLLVQKAKQDPNLSPAVSPNGGNCVIKAIIMNSAKKLPYWHKGNLSKQDDHAAPLDYIQGAGMLDALGAYKNLIAGPNKPGNCPQSSWDNNKLDTNQPENVYRFALAEPNDKFITATLNWNRHYKNTYPFASLEEKNSDLRLELWATDINNPDNDYLLDYSDSRVDNVEHIHCPADSNYTNYEIVVSFSDVEDLNEPNLTEQYGLAFETGDGIDSNDILWYDLNSDGIVNDSDVTLLFDNLSADKGATQDYPLGDINSDGNIDFNDVYLLLKNINRQADWNTKVKPE